MARVPFFQLVKHQIDGVLKFLVVLPNLHGVYHLQQRGEVLFLLRGLVVDVADECRIKQHLGLQPEIVPGLSALTLGVDNEAVHQLQNVLLAMDVRKRVIVVGLLEVYGVHDLDAVALAPQHFPALNDDTTLGECFVKINKGNISPNFASKIR